MANTNEGLSTVEPDEQVNTEAGFEAALAGKGVTKPEGEASASDTSVASGLTVAAPAQTHGEDGKFEPKNPPAPAAETAAGDAEPEIDPEITALLAKYDNDPVKALKAAADAQRLIGSKETELQGTRERLAKLEGVVETLTKTATAPTTPALTDDQVEEQALSVVQAKGYSAAATEAANVAFQTGDERLYRNIVEAWQLEEPFNAMTFVGDFQAWKREQAQEKPASGRDPWALAQEGAQAMNATIATLAEERKDTWPTIAPFMEKALEAQPPAVAVLVSSQDPAERLAGVRILADRATLMASAAATDGGEKEHAAAVLARKLAGSAVATGALRPAAPAGGAGGEKSRDEQVKEFKQELLGTETTSVASGLTFGKS